VFYARNVQPVAANYAQPYYPDEPLSKLTVQVFDNDVTIQVTESTDQSPPMFSDPNDTEAQLPVGFHTLVPVTAWTGFRFRTVDPARTARVSFRAYG
jgi:hypothetical protein